MTGSHIYGSVNRESVGAFYRESGPMNAREQGTTSDQSTTPARYEGARLILQHGRATVGHRVRDLKGEIIGEYNSNPLLDSQLYEVTYDDDGHTDIPLANTIAEAIYASVDNEGHE